jgi:hypothetical protein
MNKYNYPYSTWRTILVITKGQNYQNAYSFLGDITLHLPTILMCDRLCLG